MRREKINTLLAFHPRTVKFLLLIFTLAFTCIPFLFWGGRFAVGGDDSKLYYMFPWEYFKNFTTTIISDNQLGVLGTYFPQSYISGFALFIFALKNALPFLNTQLLMFGLNIGLGFLFFYLLLEVWIRTENWSTFWAKVIGGLTYTFSAFTFHSLWSSELFGLYLISFFPLALYLFFRGVQEKKLYFIVLCAVLFSIFSALILSVPYFVALSIAALPLGLIIFWQYKRRFLFFLLFFCVLMALLNAHWLFHLIYGPYSSDQPQSINELNSVVSVDTRKANEFLIREVSKHNQLLYPFINLFHKNLQQDYGWTSYRIFRTWNSQFVWADFLFPMIFILAAASLRQIKRSWRVLFFSAVASWMVIFYLFTVNIGSWGTDLFLWLDDYVPGFVMFRNMYDKFGPAMAFSTGILLAISSAVVLTQTKRRFLRWVITIAVIALIFVNAKPFIFDEYHNNPLWTTQHISTKITDFNSDFYDLITYLKKMDTAERFSWLPLNATSYVVIQDKTLSNNYYIGVSPIAFMTKKADLTGRLGFNPVFADKLFTDILHKKYQEVGTLLQQIDVRYLIINKKIPREIQNSYLYTVNSTADLFRAQDENLYHVILGKKLQDFGDQYALYEIAPQYQTRKIYLTNDYDTIATGSAVASGSAQVEYKKLNSYEYSLHITHLSATQKLVLLDPYHKQWVIKAGDPLQTVISGSHDVPFQYANGWSLDPQVLKMRLPKNSWSQNSDGSMNTDLFIYFQPQAYSFAMICISLLTFGLAGLFLLYSHIFRSSHFYAKKT